MTLPLSFQRFSRLLPPPADRHRLARLLPVFALSSIGNALGPPAYMALFNSRLGVEYLPFIYMASAIGLPLSTTLVAGLAGRLPRARFNLWLAFVLAGIVLAAGVVIILVPHVNALYFVVVVVSDIALSLRDMQLWSMALVACDSQQAQRLFPLFTAGKMSGSIVGGILAGLLAGVIGAPGVYLTLGGLLLVTALALIPTARAYLRLPGSAGSERREGSLTLTNHLAYLRRSPFFMLLIAVSMVWMALIYSSEYIYNFVAQAHFEDEAALTAFFGFYLSIYNLVVIVVSLGLTSRLLRRWGVGNVVLSIGGIYLAVFGLFAGGVAGPMALTTMFVACQLFDLGTVGIGEPAVNVLYMVAPPARRDSFKLLIEGIYTLLGVGLGSGLIMLHSQGVISLTLFSAVGLALAGGFLLLSLQMRGFYVRALLDALVAGRADLIAETPAMLGRPTPATLITLGRALADARSSIRKLALEVVARLNAPESLREVLPLLDDANPSVRASAVRTAVALAIAPSSSAASKRQVVESLQAVLANAPPETIAAAVVGLEKLNAPDRPARLAALEKMLTDAHPQAQALAVDAIAEAGLSEMAARVLAFLSDENAWLRERAVHALGALACAPSIPALLKLLPSADRTLRRALVEALSRMQDAQSLLEALPSLPLRPQTDVLLALARSVNAHTVRQTLVDLSLAQLTLAADWPPDGLPSSGVAGLLRGRLLELKDDVCNAALELLGELTDPAVVQVLHPALRSADPDEQSTALEALGSLGERRLAAEISAVFTKETPSTLESPAPDSLVALQAVNDLWVQTLAHCLEPASCKETPMSTDQTLDLNRLIALKQVPLFAELSLDELQAIASVTTEESFLPGDALVRQGELGDKLFILMSGKARVVRGTAVLDKTIVELGAGEVVGEMGLLDEEPRSASVIALAPIQTLSLQRAPFLRLLYQYPEMAERLMRVLVRRIRVVLDAQ